MGQRKGLWIVILLVCLLVLLGCDASTAATQTDQGTTDTPTPQGPTPTETVAQQANDVVQSVGLAGAHVRVTLSGSSLTISEDLTQYAIGGNGLIVDNIRQGCYDVQKAVWTSAVSRHLSQVELTATSDTQDQYGKVSHGTVVGYCTLSQQTAKRFQWDNLSREDAWNVYDNAWLIPFLTQ